MCNKVAARLEREEGVGIVSTLVVAFIVFSLGATWYALAIHELDEVTFDRNRTAALNVAESAAREAMAYLANNTVIPPYTDGFKDLADTAGAVTSGIAGSACVMQLLETTDGGAPDQVGEYWVRVEHLGGLDYFIESWGWAPSRQSRQTDVKKVELQVELVPLGGFKHALFAASDGITGGNRKEIYGNVYSGNDLVISNQTEVFANDPGHYGDGDISSYRDVIISNGSNTTIGGLLAANGYVRDNNAGTEFLADVEAHHDNPLSPHTESHFKNADVAGEVRLGGTHTGSVSGTVVENVTFPSAIPNIALPVFTYSALNYPGWDKYTHASVSDFNAWISSNEDDVHGVHKITGGGTIDFKQTTFTGDFVLVAGGDLTVKGTPDGADLTATGGEAITAIMVMDDASAEFRLGQSFNSLPGEIHHLLFSNGDIKATQQSTIYGAIYGQRDISTNRLEIHFREPKETTTPGFAFDPALADRFLAEPGVWRDVPETEPSGTGIATYCTLP